MTRRHIKPDAPPAGAMGRRAAARNPISARTARGFESAWRCLRSSIAVAISPLRNLTGHPDHQQLVEAVTEDIVDELVHRGRGISLQRLSSEPSSLGKISGSTNQNINYLVSGSAQRGRPGMLRINVRITDAATSEYLWARRYEFSSGDAAAFRSRITHRVSRELHVLLLQQEIHRACLASGSEREPNECLSSAAMALERELRRDLTAEAQLWYLVALGADPRNVEAYVGLARTCQELVSNPWWGDPIAVAVASDLGREVVAIALELAPGHADAHCIQGMLYSAAGRLGKAAEAFERALAMDQGLAIAHGFAGYNTALLGNASGTLPAIERAMRLDPTDRRHSIWFFFAGFAELLIGRTEAAITLLEKSLERNRSYGSAQLFLMAALSKIGRHNDAVAAAASFRQQYPDCPAGALAQLWLSRSASATYRSQILSVFETIRELGVTT